MSALDHSWHLAGASLAVIPCPGGTSLFPRPVQAFSLGASLCGQFWSLVCTPGTKEWLPVGVQVEFRSSRMPTHAIMRLLATWGLCWVWKGPWESENSKFKPGILIIMKGCVCVPKYVKAGR